MLWMAFNCLRPLAKERHIDTGRLNRALGLAQRRDQATEYETTLDSCTCDDSFFRPSQVCKHRLAALLRGVAFHEPASKQRIHAYVDLS
jgi:hypothetical protein